jgi:LPXTG-site transpeptidase (sortase) family protein
MRLVALIVSCLLVVACGGDDEEAAPTATVAADGETSATDTISIPSIVVDAPLTPRRLIEGEPLPSPDGPYDVAMYDFGAGRTDLGGAPGQGGNVVLSGQNLALAGCIGAQPPCDAVFRSLRQVEGGAAVDLAWKGDVYDYQVVSVCTVPTADFDDDLYRRTPEEQLTLLTGAGDWNSTRGWSQVLVVIAKPAPRTAVEPCPEGTEPVRSVGA